MAQTKTNAMRKLDTLKIPYTLHEYATADGAIDGISVAAKLSQDPALVFKTLVTIGSSGSAFVFAVPVAAELDLKKAAKSVGQKSIAMLPAKDLLKTTGYVHGGCSPIGMKKQLVTVLDSSAQGKPAMMVSAGRIGSQIELNPADLARITGAKFADILTNSEHPVA